MIYCSWEKRNQDLSSERERVSEESLRVRSDLNRKAGKIGALSEGLEWVRERFDDEARSMEASLRELDRRFEEVKSELYEHKKLRKSLKVCSVQNCIVESLL